MFNLRNLIIASILTLLFVVTITVTTSNWFRCKFIVNTSAQSLIDIKIDVARKKAEAEIRLIEARTLADIKKIEADSKREYLEYEKESIIEIGKARAEYNSLIAPTFRIESELRQLDIEKLKAENKK